MRALCLSALFFLIVLDVPAMAQTGIVADFDQEVRETTLRADGLRHVDTPGTIQKLVGLHANSYFFVIGHGAASDYDDFRNEFLAASAQAGINVWAYLKPPSECKPCSMPFQDDYIRWATELAKLSLQHSNLKGFAIDDFTENLGKFTVPYTLQMSSAAKSVNSSFSFFPLLYWAGLQGPFFDNYRQAIDGAIFAYRDEPNINTFSTASLAAQLAAVEAKAAADGKALILMVYCAPLSGPNSSLPTASYVQTVLSAGLADMQRGKLAGVVTYVLDVHNPVYANVANLYRTRSASTPQTPH